MRLVVEYKIQKLNGEFFMSALDALRNKFKFDPESPWYFYRKVIWWSFIVSVCITVPFVIVEWVKTGSPVFLYYGDYNVQQICFYEHAVFCSFIKDYSKNVA